MSEEGVDEARLRVPTGFRDFEMCRLGTTRLLEGKRLTSGRTGEPFRTGSFYVVQLERTILT
jgi:hypothetical protein